MKMVNITIDGIAASVPEKTTVLEAARKMGIRIPTLCFLKEINEIGACRICLVEVEKSRGLVAACVYPVWEGMVVHTNSPRVRKTRRATLEMILSDHNRDCLSCIRNGNCELQTIADEYGIRKITFEGEKSKGVLDTLSESIVRDGSKCIKCGRCVAACKKQEVGVLSFIDRGFDTSVGPAFDVSMADAPCIYCGQCVIACPVGALYEKEATEDVWAAIHDSKKHVVVQVAPAVRAALGEEFGLPIGTRVTGKMFAALHRLGFDKVYDTNFGADLTIMEEGHELLHRLRDGGPFPMITSCSPGWVRFCEFYYPEFLPNLSSCKSPQQMEGAIIKTYYAQKNEINPRNIVSVSVMPCTSKKTEAAREQLKDMDGMRDVDIVITTRELARMIREAGIDFNKLPDEEPDRDLLGEYSGAGAIFGVTGGVMEASLRTVADILENKALEDIEYKTVRGVDADVKEAELTLGGRTIRVAVAHGTAAAVKLLDAIKKNESPGYTFIEVMGCSGGCICGGGQPQIPSQKRMDIDVRKARAKALYEEDKSRKVRKSHLNSDIMKLYEDFLGEPNGYMAHQLLHTHNYQREVYPDYLVTHN